MNKILDNSFGRPFRKLKSAIHSNSGGNSPQRPGNEKEKTLTGKGKAGSPTVRKTLSDILTEELLLEAHETIIENVQPRRSTDNSKPSAEKGQSGLLGDATSSQLRRSSSVSEKKEKAVHLWQVGKDSLQKSSTQRPMSGNIDNQDQDRAGQAGVREEPKGNSSNKDAGSANVSELPSRQSASGTGEGSGAVGASSSARSNPGAKERWKKLKNSVVFANNMSARLKSVRNADLLDESAALAANVSETGNGGEKGQTGTSKDSGPRSVPGYKPKGKASLENFTVKKDKSMMCLFTDFYVHCLQLPTPLFLAGVFSSPVILGLLFTPLYLFDINGLQFDEDVIRECPADAHFLALATYGCSVATNVFLYALSLSTTFGGSPLAAVSPFTLIVANINTLMAQLLFVFLSGAVFARMSQPGQSIRCSKKAIIRNDDIYPSSTRSADNDAAKKTLKVFAMRLVLTGPDPCELVDVKISLTFRVFLRLPSGSLFCSTHDLPLVRSEVPYLRYGIMCRHIIDENSPVYGHSKETLLEGDASFSITVLGMERTSMQSIFHIQDYYIFDGDVTWDSDYHDFVSINEKGVRVLDHSKLDHVKHFKVGGLVSAAISRMSTEHHGKKDEESEKRLTSWQSLTHNSQKIVSDMGDAVSETAVSATKTLHTWITGVLRSNSFTRQAVQGGSDSFTRRMM